MEVTDHGRCGGFQCREAVTTELRVLKINTDHLLSVGRLVELEGD